MVAGYIPKYFTGRLHDSSSSKRVHTISVAHDADKQDIMDKLNQFENLMDLEITRIEIETGKIEKMAKISLDHSQSIQDQLDNFIIEHHSGGNINNTEHHAITDKSVSQFHLTEHKPHPAAPVPEAVEDFERFLAGDGIGHHGPDS